MTRILTLYPDTFLWEDGVSGLLYNAKNYQSYEFLLMPFLSDLSHRLLDFSNLYSVDIEDEDMEWFGKPVSGIRFHCRRSFACKEAERAMPGS